MHMHIFVYGFVQCICIYSPVFWMWAWARPTINRCDIRLCSHKVRVWFISFSYPTCWILICMLLLYTQMQTYIYILRGREKNWEKKIEIKKNIKTRLSSNLMIMMITYSTELNCFASLNKHCAVHWWFLTQSIHSFYLNLWRQMHITQYFHCLIH